ncbi:MAG: fumarylacetoacetase, partial [Burkholderiales bacterium]|nr:fumarylacetoacetase [Burkholderiales bacterium]
MNIEANNPDLKSFIAVECDSHFPIQNLPFGIFAPHRDNHIPRAGVAIGEYVIDLAELERAGFFKELFSDKNIFDQASLNPFMALGKPVWTAVRNKISQLLRYDEPILRDNLALRKLAIHSRHDITMLLPIKISGYT